MSVFTASIQYPPMGSMQTHHTPTPMTNEKERLLLQADVEPRLTLRQVLELPSDDEDDSSDRHDVPTTNRLQLDQLLSSLPDDDNDDETIEIVTTRNRPLLWKTVQSQSPPQSPPLLFTRDHQEDDFEIVSQKPSITWPDNQRIVHQSHSWRIWIHWRGTMQQDIGFVSSRWVLVMVGTCAGFCCFLILLFYWWIQRRSRQRLQLRAVKRSPPVETNVREDGSSLTPPLPASSSPPTQVPPVSSKKRKSNDDPPTIRDIKRPEHSPNPPSLCKEHADQSTKINEPDQSRPPDNMPSLELGSADDSMESHCVPETTAVTSSASSFHRQAMQNAASQVALDIQIVQQVFELMSLDVSLAPQVAINLRCSQQLLVAQAAHHQELLLQQQQQQQHIRQSSASYYDYNWKDKLRQKRDESWHEIYRLLWEVALAHWVIRVARPVLPILQSNEGTLLTSAHCLQLVMQALCDCETSTQGMAMQEWTTSPTTGTSSTFGTATFWVSFLSTTNEVFWQFWGWDNTSYGVFELGACYGYCLVSTSLLLLMVLVGHQVLRAFSSPIVLHHAVNIVAISILSGAGSTPLQNLVQFIPFGIIWPLLVGAAGILAVVEWNYQAQRRLVLGSKDFRTSWDQCQDKMESLQRWVTMTRYAALLIATGTMILFLATDGSQLPVDMNGVMVEFGTQLPAIAAE